MKAKDMQTDIFSRFVGMKYLPHWAVLLIDTGLTIIAFALSYLIRVGLFNDIIQGLAIPLWAQLIVLECIQIACFWMFHTYSGIIRFSTFVDTIKVLLATVCTCAVAIGINMLVLYFTGSKIFLNTFVVLYVFVAFTLLFCFRVGVKTVFEMANVRSSYTRNVLIYGVSASGISIAKMLRSGDTIYRPVGFIDDAPKSSLRELVGLRVYKLSDGLIEYMQKRGITGVIMSSMMVREGSLKNELKTFIDNGIHIFMAPYFTELDADNKALPVQINRIEIEDLLERPTIKMDMVGVSEIVKDRVVLVTGAAGSIGSELTRQLIEYQPKAIILLEQAESPLHDLTMDLVYRYPQARVIPRIGDIRCKDRVEEIFQEFKPDVVYHAAAYKHVPLMENHPNEAIRANVLGTKNLADASVKYGVEKFVIVSTDKAVNPTNVMGCSKRIAEIYVQSLNRKIQKEGKRTQFITTRFGNVLGSNGSVIPYFKKQIAQGGPVTVTHPDIIRYFMTISEACNLVLEASALGKGGEIFVFDMGTPIKIYDLAKNMIRLAGLVPGKDIQIEFTGLRPGEKLYEELLNQKEKTLPTSSEKIMIAKVREVDFDEIAPQIEALIAQSMENKPYLTVSLMKKIVPEYKSNNSIYESLDK